MTRPMQRQKPRTQASQAQHYVWIQAETRSDDGEGGFSSTWTNVGDKQISAAILPLKAMQRYEYKTKNVDATHFVKIRGRVTVSENTNRFLFGTRIFEILTVEDLQERGFVKWCLCLEKR